MNAVSTSSQHQLIGVLAFTLKFNVATTLSLRLDMLSALDPSRNLRLSGQVIFTGRSSMEVVVKMESIPVDGAGEETVLIGAIHISLSFHIPITARGRKILDGLSRRIKHRRQSQALRSLSRVPPSSEEAQVLHEFWLKFGEEETWKKSVTVDGKERVWMGETMVEKTMLMFPQERNVHSKVFGGYLMRLAYELGFTNASLFTRGHVRFLSLDKIAFARPVPIGSILKLTSCVLHSTSTPQFPVLVVSRFDIGHRYDVADRLYFIDHFDKLQHIGVKADVIDPKTGQEQTTNDFRFTWCRDHGPPLEKVVVPRTYRGSMLWLEGRRALQIGNAIRDLRAHTTNPSNSPKDS
ncbi:Thioesterase/thiol ester dehydrase-isomerase [Salix suchowensis]|nr:Thioesterase/thiol ester dehydrase-isomerase [Salix suchowensis]